VPWQLDTSVAVPLLVFSHTAHAGVSATVGRRRLRLGVHAALETYSVLTRLPGDARLTALDASHLVTSRFGEPTPLVAGRLSSLIADLAALGIAGGAVYDALIAVTAADAGDTLLTRDSRAAATYTKLGVSYRLLD